MTESAFHIDSLPAVVQSAAEGSIQKILLLE